MFSQVDIGIGLALLLMGGRGKQKAGPKASSTSTAPKHPNGAVATPIEDAAHLLKRANQPQALAWAAAFADFTSPPAALALARWAGLESSGNPNVRPTSLGERGLMQAGKDSVSEGVMSQVDWADMINPRTSREDQAAIAVRYVHQLWLRAARYIETPPVDPVDQIWYAYLYHQRPVDVRDSHMHGPAAEMSIELAADWHTDAHKLHRLMAANVVAWGDPAGAPVAHATDPGAS